MRQDVFGKLFGSYQAVVIPAPAPGVEPVALEFKLSDGPPERAPAHLGDSPMWDSRNLIFDIYGLAAPYLSGHIYNSIRALLRELTASTTAQELSAKLRRTATRIDIFAAELGFELIENQAIFAPLRFYVNKPLATRKSAVFTAMRQRGHEASRELMHVAGVLDFIATPGEALAELFQKIPTLKGKIEDSTKKLYFLEKWSDEMTHSMFQ